MEKNHCNLTYNLIENHYQIYKAGSPDLRNKCEDIHDGECLNWDLIYCMAGWETGLCPGANNIKVAFITYDSKDIILSIEKLPKIDSVKSLIHFSAANLVTKSVRTWRILIMILNVNKPVARYRFNYFITVHNYQILYDSSNRLLQNVYKNYEKVST